MLTVGVGAFVFFVFFQEKSSKRGLKVDVNITNTSIDVNVLSREIL